MTQQQQHQQQLDAWIQHFDAVAAADLDVVFQYQLAGDDHYFIAIQDGSCSLSCGEYDDPDATLSMDDDTLQQLLSGELDGMQAFMEGKLQVSGDMMLATRLNALFPLSESS